MKKVVINPVVATYLSFSSLFSFAFAFIIATYVPFLTEKGMNLWQINVINASFMLFNVLSEMPTGIFADRFGRHHSITISCFLLSFSFLIYYFSNSFWLFILAEVIGAIGRTFVSGALSAWITDSLITRGEFHLKDKVFRQESSFRQVGVIAGCIIGSQLGGINLSLPWLGTILFMFLAGIFSYLFIKENYVLEMKNKSEVNLIKQITDSCRQGVKNKKLFYVVSFGALVAFSIQAMNMQWTLLFKKDYNFDSSQLGYLFVFISIFMSLGGLFSKYITKLVKDERLSLIVSQLITAITMIIASRAGGLLLMSSAFLLNEFGRGTLEPLTKNYTNNIIKSKQRATMLSFESMFAKLGAFIGLLVSGFLANSFGILNTWLFSGVFLLIGIIIFLIIIKKAAPSVKKTP